jgi:hypothetical protein
MNKNLDLDLHLEQASKLYNEKLKDYSNTFFSVLDDFKKYYVFTHKNPDVDEYQNYFLNSKNQLQNINKDIILLSNKIKKDIEKLNHVVTRVNIQLGDEKDLNGELLKLVQNIKNSNNGSSLLLDETTSIYNKQYLYNTELVILIFILGGLIIKCLNPSKSNH